MRPFDRFGHRQNLLCTAPITVRDVAKSIVTTGARPHAHAAHAEQADDPSLALDIVIYV